MASWRRAGAALLAGAAMTMTACSDDGGGESKQDESPILASLRQIPESARVDGPEVIVYGDLERAGRLIGRSRPDFDPDEADDFFDWVRNLVGFPLEDDDPEQVFIALPGVTAPNQINELAEFTDELGWSAIEMRSFVEYQVPPNSLTVMTGDFSADRIDDAVGEREDDIWRLGGDDLSISPGDRSVARPLGESVRMALDDDRLAVSRSTGPIEDWLGDGETLADDADLAAVATALDAGQSYSAIISVEASGSRAALGVGLSVVDGTPMATFAYRYDDAADAKDAADRFEALIDEGSSLRTQQRWGDVFDLVDITVDDRSMIATVSFTDFRAQNLFALVYAQDNLITLE